MDEATLIEPVDHDDPPSSEDPLARPTATEMIRQVALALGIPPEALSQSALRRGDRARILAENAEALRIFAGITDPKAREQGLAYLRWIADENALR